MTSAEDQDRSQTEKEKVEGGASGRARRKHHEVATSGASLTEVGKWIKEVLKHKSNVSKVPDEYRQYLSNRVRKAGRLNQADLAAVLGISSARMSEILNGKYKYLTEATLLQIVDVLRMSLAEKQHLLDLYHSYSKPQSMSRSTVDAMVHTEEFTNLLAQLEPLPAMLCNWRLDILAWNPAMTRMIGDFDHLKRTMPDELNVLYQMFCNSEMRLRFVDWEAAVAELCASFRKQLSRFNDPESVSGFDELIHAIETCEPLFTHLWNSAEIRLDALRPKSFRHPDSSIGTLVMDQWVLDVFGFDGRLSLVIFVPRAKSDTMDAFRRLQSSSPLSITTELG